MRRDNSQWIKRLAFNDSASGKGANADEKLHRSHCRRVGGLICSGRIESRYSGGLNGNEIMRIRNMDQGWKAPGAERISMDKMVIPANKPYGIDVDDKIICQPSSIGGDY